MTGLHRMAATADMYRGGSRFLVFHLALRAEAIPCGASPWGHRAYRCHPSHGMETALSMGRWELT